MHKDIAMQLRRLAVAISAAAVLLPIEASASGKPVMTADVTGTSTIYYDNYIGN